MSVCLSVCVSVCLSVCVQSSEAADPEADIRQAVLLDSVSVCCSPQCSAVQCSAVPCHRVCVCVCMCVDSELLRCDVDSGCGSAGLLSQSPGRRGVAPGRQGPVCKSCPSLLPSLLL